MFSGIEVLYYIVYGYLKTPNKKRERFHLKKKKFLYTVYSRKLQILLRSTSSTALETQRNDDGRAKGLSCVAWLRSLRVGQE